MGEIVRRVETLQTLPERRKGMDGQMKGAGPQTVGGDPGRRVRGSSLYFVYSCYFLNSLQ